MRNRCGDPSRALESGVSMVVTPEYVRANRPPPANVLKSAHGTVANV
jgi:hypothetical protein